MIDLKQLVLYATNGGLDIILSVYPQAKVYLDNRKSFKIRDERTPSCTMKQNEKGIWYVHDFGSGEHLSPFDCYMKERGIQFVEALYELAEHFNVDYSIKKEINKPSIIEKTSHRKVNDWLEWTEKATTLDELKVFIPFLQFQREEDSDESTLFQEYLDVFHRYGWRSVESYTRFSKGMETTYIGNKNFPMFVRHCGDWQKFYFPYAYNKSDRFFSHGVKPKDYINGLAELKEAYRVQFDLWKKNMEKERVEDGRKKKAGDSTFKLPEAVICSGERDAMCIAMLGMYPLWLNSETAKLTESQFSEILHYVDKVYNVPDIDSTGIKEGKKLALQHLELYTIELPASLRTHKDNRGKPRKDLRDYLELHPSKYKFSQLMKNAETAKFWEQKGKRTTLSYTGLLYFLQLNGFYKWEDEISNKISYVQLLDNRRVVSIEPFKMDDFMRGELKRRRLPIEVKEAYLQSKKILTHLFEGLETISLNFTNYTANDRIFDFKNCVVCVSKEGVKTINPEDTHHHIWEDKVIPYEFTRLEQSFEKCPDGSIMIKLTTSNLQRFLMNSSRIFWREEFEKRATNNIQTEKEYRDKFHYSITGDRLTQKEIEEQILLYFNKMYFIGNILHRYKSKSHGFGYWLLENNLIQNGISSGGSGKSFLINTFRYLHLLNVVNLDGREKKMIDNMFFLERVDSQTDLVNIDDISQEANFYSFYNKLSGDTVINPKSKTSFEIKFEKSPYFSFTSNFAQPSNDPSTMRRLISVPFSDYYHQKTENNDYLETRTIKDDMGHRELFGEDYSQEEYNADINFYLDCLIFYLEMRHQDKVCRPPMENVLKRIAIQQMGGQFIDFCDTYFLVQHNTDQLIVRHELYEEYRKHVTNGYKTVTAFKSALEQYCTFKGFIFCPETLSCYSKTNKRLIKECFYAGEKKVYEMVYIQTDPNVINNELPKRYRKK